MSYFSEIKDTMSISYRDLIKSVNTLEDVAKKILDGVGVKKVALFEYGTVLRFLFEDKTIISVNCKIAKDDTQNEICRKQNSP